MDNGSNNSLNVYPSIDAIQEVRVLTSNYGAQYGRNASGTIEAETKSGTSSFHGDVYEFNRNNIFNDRSYFDLSSPNAPEYKKNDWGYTIGGPVYIPGHYNTDKSKTFFFWLRMCSARLGFPSKDGFWVSLDGIIEFRIKPEKAAEVYVVYNERKNGDAIDEEIIDKIIRPSALSFCRLYGSNESGRQFIQGETRTQFQEEFQKAMKASCDPLGVEIIQALITKIKPPQKIAKPVREREIAKQQELQYRQQILQQESQQKLAIETEMVKQKEALVKADQEVIKVTTEAKREQEVAITKANEELNVAQFKLEAAKDEAAAVTSIGKAAAEVVRFQNEAEAAGWKQSVTAFGGEGAAFARYTLYERWPSAYRDIMVNTKDSPIMRIFETFAAQQGSRPRIRASRSVSRPSGASDSGRLYNRRAKVTDVKNDALPSSQP